MVLMTSSLLRLPASAAFCGPGNGSGSPLLLARLPRHRAVPLGPVGPHPRPERIRHAWTGVTGDVCRTIVPCGVPLGRRAREGHAMDRRPEA
ncbi:hypothetical protein SF23_00315 [Streptomyces sp. MBRL 10]|nr:hypothetical protein SF23_00315 [Streptomyces sp. MBRL 10]